MNVPASSWARRSTFERIAIGLMLGTSASLVSSPRLEAREVTESSVAAYGPVEYDPATVYAADSVVRAADDNFYRAIKQVEAIDPATDDGSAWRLELVKKSVVLDVPGRFDTVTDAWSFLADATITSQATVTVQLAPGRYSFETPLCLDHKDAARILVDGGRRPKDCVLVFTRTNGIEVNDGGGLLIKGITVKAADEGASQYTGIAVGHGANVRLENCTIEGFHLGVLASDGGRIEAKKSSVTTTADRANTNGFRAANTGVIILVDCSATKTGGSEYSIGFMSTSGGFMVCEGCVARDWEGGFHANRGGDMKLRDSRAEGNNTGLSAFKGSAVDAQDCAFTGNTLWGINASTSAVVASGCSISGSRVGCWAVSGGSVHFADRRSRIRNCSVSALSSKGGGTFDGIRPEMSANRTQTTVIPNSTPPGQVILWN